MAMILLANHQAYWSVINMLHYFQRIKLIVVLILYESIKNKDLDCDCHSEPQTLEHYFGAHCRGNMHR